MRMPQPPLSHKLHTSQPPPQFFGIRQLRSSTMAEDTLILISQLQHETSDGKKDLWDFGSYPERKCEGLLFEKVVLDIQVGRGSVCSVFV